MRQKRVVELGEGMPFYCKLNLAYYKPPAVIEIKYQNELGGDILMFGSFSCDEPSNIKKDVERNGRPTLIVVYPKNDPTSQSFGDSDSFNMGFFGDETIEIRASFGIHNINMNFC